MQGDAGGILKLFEEQGRDHGKQDFSNTYRGFPRYLLELFFRWCGELERMNIKLSDHFTYRKFVYFALPTIGMVMISITYDVIDG